MAAAGYGRQLRMLRPAVRWLGAGSSTVAPTGFTGFGPPTRRRYGTEAGSDGLLRLAAQHAAGQMPLPACQAAAEAMLPPLLPRLAACDTAELAAALRAAAQLRLTSPALLAAAARRVTIGGPLEGPAGALAAVACDFVAAGGRDEDTLLALGDDLLAADLATLSGPQLAALAAAFAAARVCHFPLLSAAAALLAEPQRLEQCGLPEIADAMGGFAKLQVRNAAAATATIDHVVARGLLQSGPPTAVAQLTLALAKLPLQHAAAMRAAAARLSTDDAMGSLTAPQVADVLWSFAKLKLPEAVPLQSAARRLLAEGVLAQFTPTSAVNTLWALAKLGASYPALVAAVAAEVRGRRLVDHCWAMELHSLAWALASLGHRDETLMHTVAENLLRDPTVLQMFSVEALGSLRWAFQRLRVAHPRLLDALAAEVRRQREAEGGLAH
eukprot:EG_transcript_10313